jgi:hypothetical protein
VRRRVGWSGHPNSRGTIRQHGDPRFFRIRNGRVGYFHAYEDSEKVARACEQMAALGVEEASAAPIID